MFARASWIVAIFVPLCVYIHAQSIPSKNEEPVSQVCLACICEVATGCNTTIGCSGPLCGPYAITWGFWTDAGTPTLNNEPNDTDGAYSRCVNDLYCAARTIQGYMAKFNQDCTGNGVIDCDDYLRIYRLGAYGCTAPLDDKYEKRYKLCIATFGNK
ncbi:lysozyme [Camponotus japonicus]